MLYQQIERLYQTAYISNVILCERMVNSLSTIINSLLLLSHEIQEFALMEENIAGRKCRQNCEFF